MAKTLHKLTDDYKVLENMLDREEYDFDQEGIKQSLNSLKVDIEDKVENVAKFVLSLQAQAEMIKTEEARLRARRNALENRAEWLKSYLLNEMSIVMIDKVKREVITVSIQKSPPSVEILNLQALPEQYTKTTIEPQKYLIIKHFKDTGEVLPGINMITNKKHLVIR